jgi:hypothetical protein
VNQSKDPADLVELAQPFLLAARCGHSPIQPRMAVVGNIDIGKEAAPRRAGQRQMAGAMSKQDTHVMGDNECAPQKLVRLVGCRDPKARLERADPESRTRQFGETKP